MRSLKVISGGTTRVLASTHGRQRAAPLLEALARLLVGGFFIVLVFAGALLRDDEGVGMIPERLQAVDVVGMIVAQRPRSGSSCR